MIRSETIGKIAAAFVKAQSDMTSAKKDASNPFYKSKYADYEGVVDAVKPHLNRHGIAYSCIPMTEGVEVLLIHESGEYFGGLVPYSVIATIKTAQDLGGIITYFKRYGLAGITGLPTIDDDGNAASGKIMKIESKQQAVATAIPQKQFKPAAQPSQHGF